MSKDENSALESADYATRDFSHLIDEEIAGAMRSSLVIDIISGLFSGQSVSESTVELNELRNSKASELRAIAEAAGLTESDIIELIAEIRNASRDTIQAVFERASASLETMGGNSTRNRQDMAADGLKQRDAQELAQIRAEGHNAIDNTFGAGTPEAEENKGLFNAATDPTLSPKDRQTARDTLYGNYVDAGAVADYDATIAPILARYDSQQSAIAEREAEASEVVTENRVAATPIAATQQDALGMDSGLGLAFADLGDTNVVNANAPAYAAAVAANGSSRTI